MNSKFYLFLLILLTGTGFRVSAQFNYYPFYTPDTMGFFRMADSCSRQVGLSYVVPPGVSSKYKKDFLSMKDDATDYVRSLIRYTGITDSLVYPYLQSILKKITAANPSMKNYTIVLSDWPVMNAAYVGGNVIVFFAPLLSRMNNESEVAAIICHELAHGELDHIQQKVRKNLDEYYSEAFQKELKKTLREEFNLQTKINLLAMKYTFGSRFHDRSYEKAADSLGYVFLSKTSYDTRQFASALAMLKDVDDPAYKDPIDYARFFKCPTSTFDFSGIKPYQAKSLFSVSAEKSAHLDSLTDSLRTHPDCDKRIVYIQELMKKIPAHPGTAEDSVLFKKARWAAAMEMIMGYYSYGYYDLSLFNALQYLQHYPDNEYLKAIVFLDWYGIYKSMQDHELSDYISNYSDENPPPLNDLLFLINNMRLPQMAEFGQCFITSNKITQAEYALAIGYCTAKLADDKNCSAFQDQYKSQFKKGRFTYLMEVNEKPADGKKTRKKK